MTVWLLRVAAAAILFTVLYELLPDGDMKTITGAATGIAFALVLLLPLRSVLATAPARISESVALFLRPAENPSGAQNELLADIVSDYEESCNREIAARLLQEPDISAARAEVVPQRDPSAADFGTLQHVYAYVVIADAEDDMDADQDHGGAGGSWIPPIIIEWPHSGGSGGTQAGTQSGEEREARLGELTKMLAQWLQIDSSRVTVFEEEKSYG